MRKNIILWFVAAILLNLSVVSAAEDEAQELPSASDEQWLSLLHYYRTDFGQGWNSEADRGSFFLAENGRHDPKAELLALIDAAKSSDLEAICRFPARYNWLQTGYLRDFPPVETLCPELRDWLAGKATLHLSIIFASAYLENPSSMFGHTFLRFYDERAPDLVLNTDTVNYAADASERNGVLEFAARGLFGGFPGIVDDLPFYRRVRTYAENEGRDLWEYHLDFTPAEIKLVALHVYEVRDGVFDYFFIDENCAYKTLSLLAVARPALSPIDAFSKYALPVDTIRAIDARGYITDVELWPSRLTTFLDQAGQLSEEHQLLARELARGGIDATDPRLSQLDAAEVASIYRVAYRYLSLRTARGLARGVEAEEIGYRLMQQRFHFDESNLPPPSQVSSSRPDQGHLPARLAVGYGYAFDEAVVRLALRGAYHDFDDSLSGFRQGAMVNLLDAEATYDAASGLALERFDLLRINALAPTNSFLPSTSWQFNISRLRKPVDRRFALVNSIGYARGKTVSLSGFNVSLLAGFNLDVAGRFDEQLALEGMINLVAVRQLNRFSMRFYGLAGSYVAGAESRRKEYGASAAFEVWQQRLRLELSHLEGTDFDTRRASLSWLYYF